MEGKRCKLLELPQEIQDMIWAYSAAANDPIKVRCMRPMRATAATVGEWKFKFGTAKWAISSLACTCHRIRDRILNDAIFYKNNEFEFMRLEYLREFIRGLKCKERAALRYISVPWRAGEMCTVYFCILVRDCPNLRKLKLDINRCARWFEPGSKFSEKAIGYKELLNFRGLKEFKLVYEREPPEQNHRRWPCLTRDVTIFMRGLPKVTTENLEAFEEEVKEIEAAIRSEVTQKRNRI